MRTENQRGEPEPRRTIASSREGQGKRSRTWKPPLRWRRRPAAPIRGSIHARSSASAAASASAARSNAANSSSLFVFSFTLNVDTSRTFATMTLPSSSISSPAALSRRARGAADAVAAAGFADLAAAATSSARAKAVLRAASAPDGAAAGLASFGTLASLAASSFCFWSTALALASASTLGRAGLAGAAADAPRGVRGRDRGGRRRGRREGVPVVPSSAFRAAGLGGGHLSGLRLLARALLRGARRRHLDEAANDRFSLRSTNLREIAARGDRARRRDGSRDRRRPRSTPRHARERRDARFEPRGVTATAARASLPLEGERRLEMPRRVFSSSNPGSKRAAETAGGLRRADRTSARKSLVEN